MRKCLRAQFTCADHLPILQEVGPERKVSVQGPLTLHHFVAHSTPLRSLGSITFMRLYLYYQYWGLGGATDLHLASLASFCDVWWMLSPIRDARLLNSAAGCVTSRCVSPAEGFPFAAAVELLLPCAGIEPWVFRNRSAMAMNSDVRSRPDVEGNGPIVIGILCDYSNPNSLSPPNPSDWIFRSTENATFTKSLGDQARDLSYPNTSCNMPYLELPTCARRKIRKLSPPSF